MVCVFITVLFIKAVPNTKLQYLCVCVCITAGPSTKLFVCVYYCSTYYKDFVTLCLVYRGNGVIHRGQKPTKLFVFGETVTARTWDCGFV